MTDKIVAFTTCEQHEDALRIARHLVNRRLAACVNIVPNVTSVYRWEEKVEEAAEWLLLIKTSAPLLENLKRELVSIHPYETPELIAVNIVDGAEGYLSWLDGSLLQTLGESDGA